MCFHGFGVRQIDADVGLFADSFCELRKATKLGGVFSLCIGCGRDWCEDQKWYAGTEHLSDSVISAQCLLGLGMPSSGLALGGDRRNSE